MPWLLLIVALLAAFRLTRLATTDFILDPLRRRLAGTLAEDVDPGEGHDARPWIGYLVTCPWCMSVWLSPIPVTLAVLWPDNRVILIGLVSLAASAVTGLLAVTEARAER